MHAALQERLGRDHIAAQKEPPVENLLKYKTYDAAYKAALKAQDTDKGVRPDRDPQVRERAAPRRAR